MNHENFRDNEYRIPDTLEPVEYARPYISCVDPLIVRKVASVGWTQLEREIGFKLTYAKNVDTAAFCGRKTKAFERMALLDRLAKSQKNLDIEINDVKVLKADASQPPLNVIVKEEDLKEEKTTVTLLEHFDTSARDATYSVVSQPLVLEPKVEIKILDNQVFIAEELKPVIKGDEIVQKAVEKMKVVRKNSMVLNEPVFGVYDEYHIMNKRTYGAYSGISREPAQADDFFINTDIMHTELYQWYEGYGDDNLGGFFSDLFCRNRAIIGNLSVEGVDQADRGGSRVDLMKKVFPWMIGEEGVFIRPRWSVDEDRFLWKYRKMISEDMLRKHKLCVETDGRGGLSFAINRLAIRRRVNCGLICKLLVILYERANQLICLCKDEDQELVLHWRRVFNSTWGLFRYMCTFGIMSAYNLYGTLAFDLVNELYTLGLHYCQVYSEDSKLFIDTGLRRGDPNFAYKEEFEYVFSGTDWISGVVDVVPIECYPILSAVNKRFYMCIKYKLEEIRAEQNRMAYTISEKGIQEKYCCNGVQECEKCKQVNDELIQYSDGLDEFLKHQNYVHIYNHECLWLYMWIYQNGVDVKQLIKKIRDYRSASNCAIIFHTICFLLYTMGYGHSSWILQYYVRVFPIRMISVLVCDRFTMFS